jgi:glycosyltransferase involved in cell wall biosynthesis
MNISFLSPSVSRAAGGIFEIVRSLALTLTTIPDTTLTVFGLEDELTSADAGAWLPVRVNTYKAARPNAFGYSSNLRRAFLSHRSDIVHLHALWMYSSILALEWSRHNGGRPYVTTLNGMLDPWALNNSYWKKKIASILYENRSLARAECIQVNSKPEFAVARKFGLRNPICLIPNGVRIPDLKEAIPLDKQSLVQRLKSRGHKVLLYLGRLHPKKGLTQLLPAFHRMHGEFDEWVLVIAGWDQFGHAEDLRRLAESLGLEKRVIFLGPQYGAAKDLCFRLADAFILPSYSEGLPMAVLEAWAYGKPVLITPACNLEVGYVTGAAISIEPASASVEGGLRRMFEMPEIERIQMGSNGRALVEKNFSWLSVAQNLRSVYNWLLTGGSAPHCVILD